METALVELVGKNIISRETAIEKSGNPNMFAEVNSANGSAKPSAQRAA